MNPEGFFMDFVYIAATLLFFGLSWLLLEMCERV
jgi:hypothetical protein